jgi:hypothetical protein
VHGGKPEQATVRNRPLAYVGERFSAQRNFSRSDRETKRGYDQRIRLIVETVENAMHKLFALALVLITFAASAIRAGDPASEEFFEKRVRPILAGTCFRCHGGQKVQGKLRIDAREALVKGGESGPAIDVEHPEKSLMLSAVRRDADVSAMPPDKPLAPREVEDLAAWIKAGAFWPKQAAKFEAAPHWAFQPLANPRIPAVKHTAWPQTSIDAFILAKLKAEGLEPSRLADRRTLIRRATYDLTGLPPTPVEVATFESDASPAAFEKVIDRLLASPAYGEHWGRHWLDVVRYADTAGENSDHPLPHAWRYRNWVIDALNRDLPYDQFLREQLAGDLLPSKSPEEAAERIVATGYLAIARRFGHEIDKEMHLTLEDALDNLGKTTLGLSIGCCRCHDHKFDPLSVEDYYGLYGILDSTKFPFPGCEPQQQPRDLVALPLNPAAADEARNIDAQIAQVEAERQSLNAKASAKAKDLQRWIKLSSKKLASGEIDDGKEAAWPELKLSVKQGEVIQLSVAPRGNHGADTTRIEWELAESGPEKRTWNVADLLDKLTANNPNGPWAFLDLQTEPLLLPESLSEISGKKELQAWRNGDTPSVLVNRSEMAVKVWTELAGKSFFVHPGPKGPVGVAWISPIDGDLTLRGKIADAHPGGPDGVAWQIEHFASADVGQALAVLGEQRAKAAELERRKRELMSVRPVSPMAYAVREGTPHHARIQKRGEPTDLGDEVPRKFLDALGGFKLESTSGSGRLELANWITSKENPLTPRVIVNRVWQWHFGRGIVATPNDFGTRGAPPTHPELLDHLASEFAKDGWSLKKLHRRILLSATYQQAAFQRRRLTAEEIRDTLLVAGGELERTPGEAHPFPPENTWNFTQHGPFAADYDTARRSVYVMQKRNRRHRFFTLFDGADPNSSTAARETTTVPTQALYFLNDPLVHAMSVKLAARVMAASPEEPARLNFVYELLLGRQATADEQRDAAAFFKEYSAALADRPEIERPALAWQAYARVLLSSNEVWHVE